MRRNIRAHWPSIALGVTASLLSTGLVANSLPSDELEPSLHLPPITVEAERPWWEMNLSQGAYSVVEPDRMKGEHKNLADMLRSLPGIHISEVGGSGKYTTASIRGSTSAQVGVFIDSVLVNMGGDSAVDLSAIPVENIERIEVYRGYTPARFAGTYMGGVINIVTKRPEGLTGSISTGRRSWGGEQAGLNINAPLGNGSLLFSINQDKTKGNFKYRNLEASLPGNAPSMIRQVEQNIDDIYLESETGGWDFWLGQGFSEEDLRGFGFRPPAELLAEGEHQDELEYYYSTLGERRRRNNEHKNTDALLKWQNDNWQMKASWKEIHRQLPQPLTTGTWQYADIGSSFYRGGAAVFPTLQPREHTLTDYDLLLGRRDTFGNLELGYRIHYLDQKKEYRDYNYQGHEIAPALRIWSEYHSKRLGGAVDGTWRLGSHLLEFVANYSEERLDIDGSSIASRWDLKDRYTQTLWNIQLQDTVTLNRAGDFWLTPSLRFHSSSGLGKASDFQNDGMSLSWIKAIQDTGGEKLTWSLALKKQIGEHWTVNSSYGSYYRFPNLYELVGDGAWIVPSPTSGPPSPEHGEQWDLGGSFQGNVLGARTYTSLTYFGRRSEDLIQLQRRGLTYASYLNSGSGRVHGAELESNVRWNRVEADLAVTYTRSRNTQRYYNYLEVHGQLPNFGYGKPLSDTPEWYGHLRLTWHLWNGNVSLFTEARHVDETYLHENRVISSLTTTGFGTKVRLPYGFNLTAGVNDAFNKGPKVTETGLKGTSGYGVERNPDNPIQGRTYYGTLAWDF